MSPKGVVSRTCRAVSCAIVLQAAFSNAITVDLNSTTSIKAAAAIVAYNMMQYYTGNVTAADLGVLPSPYYWWEAGAMWGAMIDYYYYTGDDTYNNETTAAMLSQVGTDDNYEPTAQAFDLGNDDQSFWGFAAMSAAEQNFPNPASDEPQWLALAQAVFNSQAGRWDAATCGGGLRWQIFEFNAGYDYKNSISNGAFFQIGARLALYTSNSTYSDWAEKTWDWCTEIGLVDDDYNVYDGTTPSENCTSIDHLQWSYNIGVFLLGAAVMWNISDAAGNATATALWRTRTQGLLNATDTFFTNNSANTTPYIMFEAECEADDECDTDELSFKAYLSRWMASSTKYAPWTYSFVIARLNPSAAAAALTCTSTLNGADYTECGFKWTTETNDGTYGVGQEMNALEVILGNMISEASAPVTASTGGSSEGDPSAGSSSTTSDSVTGLYYDITTGDKAGAGFLTALMALTTIGGAAWMVW